MKNAMRSLAVMSWGVLTAAALSAQTAPAGAAPAPEGNDAAQLQALAAQGGAAAGQAMDGALPRRDGGLMILSERPFTAVKSVPSSWRDETTCDARHKCRKTSVFVPGYRETIHGTRQTVRIDNRREYAEDEAKTGAGCGLGIGFAVGLFVALAAGWGPLGLLALFAAPVAGGLLGAGAAAVIAKNRDAVFERDVDTWTTRSP